MVGTAAAFAPSSTTQRAATTLSETKEDLEVLARKLNPIIGYYDPMNLASQNFWDTSSEATIGFLREAEVKHGRIAMFAFVGYIAAANGVSFPWAISMDGTQFPKGLSPPEAWDAIPDAGKLQIMLFVGFFEFYREVACEKHYMKGGKIGEMPPIDSRVVPGGGLNLYDPFGWSANMSEERKEDGLLKEINNGRLAMIGIFGFVSEAKVEGSVPLLKGVIPHYEGEFMAPMAKSILPVLPF